MTDEAPEPVENAAESAEEETEEYEVVPLGMGDGEVIIFDHIEFIETYAAIAVQYRDGGLYVLRSKGKWLNVEDLAEKPEKGSKLASVKGVVLAAP